MDLSIAKRPCDSVTNKDWEMKAFLPENKRHFLPQDTLATKNHSSHFAPNLTLLDAVVFSNSHMRRRYSALSLKGSLRVESGATRQILQGINFCGFLRFSGSCLLFGIIAFSSFEYKQSNTGEQHFNQLINGVPSGRSVSLFFFKHLNTCSVPTAISSCYF